MSQGQRSQGRGRLSKIDLLPEECEPLITWAAQELANRSRPQTDIYAEWRQKLIALQGELGLGFDIPSFTGFNRYSMNLARMTRRLEQTREIAATISERMDAEGSDDLTLIAAEAIKTLIFELLQDGGEAGLSPKHAMELANALRAACAAQSSSSARRLKLEKIEADFKEQAEKAIDKIATEKGMSRETIAQLRTDFLGIRPKPSDDQEPAT